MKRVFIPVALASIAATSGAYAGTDTDLGKYYVSGTVHHLTTDHQRFADAGANDGIGGHVGIGMKFTDRVSVELKVGGQQIDVNTSGSKGQTEAVLDLRYQLENGPIRPFALLGGGNVKTDLAGGNESSHQMMRFGIGFDFELTNSLDLRAQVVGRRVDDFESVPGVQDFVDYETAVGLVYWLGGRNDVTKHTAKAAPLATVQPKPMPVAIAPAPVVKPRPMPKPSPTDKDNDGVTDSSDKCPSSAPNAVVDVTGCAVADLVGAEAIRFGYDSSSLNNAATTKLDNVASILKGNGGLKAKIVGHADNAGSLAYNVQLSESRAESSINYLLNKGVNSSQVSSAAYGEVRPFGDNKTAEGRAANRRTEVNFSK